MMISAGFLFDCNNIHLLLSTKKKTSLECSEFIRQFPITISCGSPSLELFSLQWNIFEIVYLSTHIVMHCKECSTSVRTHYALRNVHRDLIVCFV